MGHPPQALGILGEELAFYELRKRGYKVLLRNYECALGEIDLIAKHEGVLVFVEVKTRSSDAMGAPAEGVTAEKRRQIIRVAKQYLQRYGILESRCRFDVAAVLIPPGEEPRIEVIQAAFGENGC
jgi:putative endonuclease